jgi:hypothetical protein
VGGLLYKLRFMGNADHDLLKKRARGGLGQGDSGVTKSKGEVNDFFRTKIVNPPTIDRRNLGQPREKVSMDLKMLKCLY